MACHSFCTVSFGRKLKISLLLVCQRPAFVSLFMLNFSQMTENELAFLIICQHWNGAGS